MRITVPQATIPFMPLKASQAIVSMPSCDLEIAIVQKERIASLSLS